MKKVIVALALVLVISFPVVAQDYGAMWRAIPEVDRGIMTSGLRFGLAAGFVFLMDHVEKRKAAGATQSELENLALVLEKMAVHIENTRDKNALQAAIDEFYQDRSNANIDLGRSLLRVTARPTR